MFIDKSLLDSLTEQAKASPRLRHLYDLRTTPNDTSQRILNALEPGTIFAIHKHPLSSTTIIVLRGAIRHFIYNDNGVIIDQRDIKACDGVQPLLQLEANSWHKMECLESGTVIFECKDGKYNPTCDTIFFDNK